MDSELYSCLHAIMDTACTETERKEQSFSIGEKPQGTEQCGLTLQHPKGEVG